MSASRWSARSSAMVSRKVVSLMSRRVATHMRCWT
ncbi:hypothetical protein Ae406Ps2_6482c [Pseudonocardia sp. Ae406_Ps2]|nr:hypothetical protein Ae406Ps2_6482c [Pseudonocardia sp. Ae406_Ps2]